MAEKIQHTKQEWINLVDDLGWNPDIMVELEEKGYIRKSLLQQKVEEAENELREYSEGYLNGSTDIDRVNRALKKANIIIEKSWIAFQIMKPYYEKYKGEKI